jgi:RHS repeat-associated protein
LIAECCFKRNQQYVFPHDALGQRISRTAGGVTTQFLTDPVFGRIWLEAQGAQTTAVYTYGNALVRKDGEYPLFDGLGSERTVTNAGQAVIGTISYDAFGQAIGTTGSSTNPYMFAATWGYRIDGDAGLMHVGARYYDAQVGRFLTRDTVLSEHPYLYCEHEPINRVDPDGHQDLDSVNAYIRQAMLRSPKEALKELTDLLDDVGYNARNVRAVENAIKIVKDRFPLKDYIAEFRQGRVLREFPSYDKYKDMPVKDVLKQFKGKELSKVKKLLYDNRFAK